MVKYDISNIFIAAKGAKMTIEQFLCDENIEKILIEKLNILNQENYSNEKKIDVNLRVSIFYSGVSSTSQNPILLKEHIKNGCIK